MTDLPPLNGLRAFDAAGRRLSFRAAAEELGVTQGAVAQHVRQLEAHLGLKLFDRIPQGLALTSEGRAYHARVAPAFADLRAATSMLKPDLGKVLISVTPSFAAKWLIPNLPDFSSTHPEIDLRILATEKISSFYSDGIDLAVRQGTPPFGASLDATLVFKQDVIAVASPDMLGANSLPMHRNTLAELPKIHDSHDMWPAALASLNVSDKHKRGLRLSQTALAIDAAVSGQGAAIVSRFLAQKDITAGRLVELMTLPDIHSQDFYLLRPRKTAQYQAANTVAAWLQTRAQA
ncbi:LysR substrate-binding domain-containing protein [Epibacterium ulvae]|uniref:LysR substrate-binding domain-containing protein n=1 Tax=Epibacterium ulvae TaxID=1156985 RepID=UPI00248FE8D9|nr:LysR substrate-binding domain-containing protein [Epibacterium ulvae]